MYTRDKYLILKKTPKNTGLRSNLVYSLFPKNRYQWCFPDAPIELYVSKTKFNIPVPVFTYCTIIFPFQFDRYLHVVTLDVVYV